MDTNGAIQDLLQRPSAWLSRREEPGIVVSSRVRLARNLRGRSFPGWAGEEELADVWVQVREVVSGVPSLSKCIVTQMSDISRLDRLVLYERNLISHEHAEREFGAGLVVAIDESQAIMVNEEDHLRLQGMLPNQNLMGAWEQVNRVDSEIEQHLDYCYDDRLGYLTACPSNVGTGMRASVMLHLPGLALMEEINKVIKGMGKIGLAVRGIGGEGSEAKGNMFQVSNQMTLGQVEEDIIRRLDEVVDVIVKSERNARKRLMQKKKEDVLDHVWRAVGILSNAHVLASKEAMDLLSGLRLGMDLGLVDGFDKEMIDELFYRTRPAHLQKEAGKTLRSRERDIERASLVRVLIREAM